MEGWRAQPADGTGRGGLPCHRALCLLEGDEETKFAGKQSALLLLEPRPKDHDLDPDQGHGELEKLRAFVSSEVFTILEKHLGDLPDGVTLTVWFGPDSVPWRN